ncbi:MAG: DUF501 domain-containing protein [Microthrixaceae bacterium]
MRRCLGREPRSRITIAARDAAGRPSVIENPPLLDDGTPMPTRYWLVDPGLVRRIGTIEAAGGVDEAEAAVGLAVIAEVHRRAAVSRDEALPAGYRGPVPSGGVGGTRVGVKCLHAHYANLLAGADDPVGRWVRERLEAGTPASSGVAEARR